MTLKILIYSIGSLGDSLVSVPALRAVRTHFGTEARIHLLHDLQDQNRILPEMVLAGTGLVDEFLNYTFQKAFWPKVYSAVELMTRLRKRRYDVVVNLLPSERPAKSLRRDCLFFSLCGIGRQIGFDAALEVTHHHRSPEGPVGGSIHESEHKLERLRRAGILTDEGQNLALPFLKVSSPEAGEARQWLASQRRYPARPLVAIGPGCKQPANLWELENFSKLGHRLVASGKFELLIVGGPGEQKSAERLLMNWGQGISSAGLFSVVGSAALLHQCQLLIGLDTGSTHLAAAVGVPCIVIQGARNKPGQWDPLGAGHVVIRKQVSCEGCLQFQCPKADHPCLKNTTVDEVWCAVDKACSRLSART